LLLETFLKSESVTLDLIGEEKCKKIAGDSEPLFFRLRKVQLLIITPFALEVFAPSQYIAEAPVVKLEKMPNNNNKNNNKNNYKLSILHKQE
jgi:hypothetical protein